MSTDEIAVGQYTEPVDEEMFRYVRAPKNELDDFLVAPVQPSFWSEAFIIGMAILGAIGLGIAIYTFLILLINLPIKP